MPVLRAVTKSTLFVSDILTKHRAGGWGGTANLVQICMAFESAMGVYGQIDALGSARTTPSNHALGHADGLDALEVDCSSV